MELAIFQQLGIALILGILVGLEREKKYQDFNYHGFGGVRTFALISLLGALSFILGKDIEFIFPLMTSGLILLILASYFVVANKHDRTGLTSEIAAILIFLTGVLCAMENYIVATVLALTVMTVLHFKESLHTWVKNLQNEEIFSTIKFLIIAFVVLPLLPNQGYGPYEFFNPFIIWLMVVFISGISFVSYIAMKVLGAKKGITLMGFLGGLISSTALTLSFSAQSKKNKKIVYPYIIAVVVAGTAMFFRILLEVAVLNRSLFLDLLVPMLTMGGVGVIAILFAFYRAGKVSKEFVEKNELDLESPFSIVPALKFGLFFAFILFLSKFAMAVMGDGGLYLTSFVSGIMDVDAITVSVANMAKSEISNLSGVIAITIAAMTNTLVKGGMFFLFGNRKVALRIMLIFGLMLLFGGASLFFIA